MTPRKNKDNPREILISTTTGVGSDVAAMILEFEEAFLKQEEYKNEYIQEATNKLQQHTQAHRLFAYSFWAHYKSALDQISTVLAILIALPFGIVGAIMNLLAYSDQDGWPKDPFQGTELVYNAAKALTGVFVASILAILPGLLNGIICLLTRKTQAESNEKIATSLWELEEKSNLRNPSEADRLYFKRLIKNIITKYEASHSARQSDASVKLVNNLRLSYRADKDKMKDILAYMVDANPGRRLFNIIADELTNFSEASIAKGPRPEDETSQTLPKTRNGG